MKGSLGNEVFPDLDISLNDGPGTGSGQGYHFRGEEEIRKQVFANKPNIIHSSDSELQLLWPLPSGP